jgi:hypothetical protein
MINTVFTVALWVILLTGMAQMLTVSRRERYLALWHAHKLFAGWIAIIMLRMLLYILTRPLGGGVVTVVGQLEATITNLWFLAWLGLLLWPAVTSRLRDRRATVA